MHNFKKHYGSSFLLTALLLTSIFSICGGRVTESVKISRDENSTYPETTIPQGTVRGVNMLTHYNRRISGFIGIPYAQPPVGDLRFKAPISPEAWNETFDASTEAEPCPQFNSRGQIAGDEDCLYLNVFTPQLPENDNSTLLPVMVFSIGGGFKTENNSLVRYGPDFLLDKDVVLVVPNFRVGLLGYLSTGDEVSPGNYGLKDMVRVLEWIQVSIRSFGGDPNAVTLFGGSSGAMSVHLLALSNLTDGLIHKYITGSGTALTYIANQPREVNANRAIQLDIEGALLIDTPANLFAAGKIRDLPWISSVTQGEGLGASSQFYADPDLFEDFLDDIDIALPVVLGYDNIVDDVPAYTTALKSYYLNNLTADRNLLLDNLTELIGDALFVYPAYNSLQQQLLLAENPQYFCSFEYRGTFSYNYLYSGGSNQSKGIAHGEELIYLFETHDSRFGPSEYEYNENDLIMVDTMLQLWTSFATNGTPTMVDSDSTDIWAPYSSLNNYLRIENGSDTALQMKHNLYIERMTFWKELTATTSGGSRNLAQVLLIALCFRVLLYIL